LKKIIIYSDKDPSQGMLTLIKYLSTALIYANSFKKKYDIKLLIFYENFFIKIKKLFYNAIQLISLKKKFSKFSYSKKFLKKFFYDQINYKDIIFCNDENFINKLNFYKILPMQKKIILNNHGIGYVYDLQHIYYSRNFSKRDRDFRDKIFLDILNSYKKVLVNSNYIKKMICKKYKNINSKIFVIPFYPYPEEKLLFDNTNSIKNYNIKNNFFLISNQFWKHKNHKIAFEAFKNFLKYNDNFVLVCTGRTEDRRFQNYFSDLKKKYSDLIKKNKIIILGEIPKIHQINLLKKCTALIQPTLYEGGPGGFSTYEAIAYGVPVILSNIEVNKEIKNENVYFFKSNNSYQLTKLMLSKAESVNTNLCKTNLMIKGNLNKKKLGDFLLKLIN
jgi:glycosyltransferase involved in cell wall biosynthesis